MAVPKSKISKSKGRSRIANWKATAPTVVDCPQCHQPKVAHSVCAKCGYYDGQQKLEVSSDKKTK